MSELDKRAEMWTQNRFGSIAIRFYGDTEYRPHPTTDAYKAGALGVLRMAEEWCEVEGMCPPNSATRLLNHLKAKLEVK